MYIVSINIKNTYSFGNEGTPELRDLRSINLFIGKNGAGKTNIVRLLLEMPIGDVHLGDVINGNEVIPSPDTKRIFKGIQGQQNRFLYAHQELNIELDEGTIITEPIAEITPFSQNTSGRASMFVGGSFDLLLKLRESSLYVSANQDKNDIKLMLSEEAEALLQFAFFYIFGKLISINNNGVTEYKNSNDVGGLGGDNMHYGITADGYLSYFNMLSQLVNNKKDLVFLEEPENNLEPRAIKRLIYFLVYYLFGEESLPAGIVSEMYQELERYKQSKLHYSKYTAPESFLVEFAQKIKLAPKRASQLFLISHSPIIIDTLRQLPVEPAIYEVFEEKIENKYSVNTEGIGIDHNETIYTEVSRVRKVAYIWDSFTVLNNIGAKNSDLLQVNGLVWVEGPSDAVYIKKFLEMYISENDLEPLIQGRDYEFAIYGGALLNSYYLYEKENNEEYLKRLVSIVSQNKNFYVVMDSDAILGEEGVVDRSKFRKAKDYIARSIDEISAKYKYEYIGYWYSKGSVKYRTIESYITLNQKVLKEIGVKKFGEGNKRSNALRVIGYLENHKILLKNINIDLENEIKKLYEKIVKWRS